MPGLSDVVGVRSPVSRNCAVGLPNNEGVWERLGGVEDLQNCSVETFSSKGHHVDTHTVAGKFIITLNRHVSLHDHEVLSTLSRQRIAHVASRGNENGTQRKSKKESFLFDRGLDFFLIVSTAERLQKVVD